MGGGRVAGGSCYGCPCTCDLMCMWAICCMRAESM